MAQRIIAAASAAYEHEGELHEHLQGEVVELPSEAEATLEAQRALVPEGFESFEDFNAYKQDAYRAGRGDVEAAQRLAERGLPPSLPDTSGGIVDLSVPNDVNAIAAHLREHEPTVDDTVALAQGEPGRAANVLEAEKLATGDKPRKGVEVALQKIIDEGGE